MIGQQEKAGMSEKMGNNNFVKMQTTRIILFYKMEEKRILMQKGNSPISLIAIKYERRILILIKDSELLHIKMAEVFIWIMMGIESKTSLIQKGDNYFTNIMRRSNSLV